SKTASLSESLLATGFPPSATNNDLNMQLYFHFTQLSHGIRRAGSAALDLCSVAAGRFEAFWELKLNPWDKAAGSLLVTEAAGRRLSRGEVFHRPSAPSGARQARMARRLRSRRLLKRRGLTTLSLSGSEPVQAPPLFAPDPEITVTDIWLRRLAPPHEGLRIV